MPSSSSLDMRLVHDYLDRFGAVAQWNSELGQSYAEFQMEGENARIWVEDMQSMTTRLESLSAYGLAGLAGWRLGMESEDVWTSWSQFFENNRRP